MARVSRAQAQQNRERVVSTAGRMFRERGVAGVSVADLMAGVGLTHGGFYKQFASKEALVTEAMGDAFREHGETLRRLEEEHPEDPRRALVEGYLSPGHRDSPGDGCPMAGFGPDLARLHGEEDAAAFAEGVEGFARWLGGGPEGLADVATLVGAVVLARATSGTATSDRVLQAARVALAETRDTSHAAARTATAETATAETAAAD